MTTSSGQTTTQPDQILSLDTTEEFVLCAEGAWIEHYVRRAMRFFASLLAALHCEPWRSTSWRVARINAWLPGEPWEVEVGRIETCGDDALFEAVREALWAAVS